MTTDHLTPWPDVLRQLQECFTAHDERMQIIGALDKCILNEEVTPEVVAMPALAGLCSQLQITAAHLMMQTANGFRTVVARPHESPSIEFAWSGTWHGDDCNPIDLRKVDPLPAFVSATRAEFRLVPIKVHNAVVGTILIEAASAKAADESLVDPFFERIVDQLEIAYGVHRDRRRRNLSERVQEAFQATQLNLSLCLQWIVTEALDTVKLDPPPIVQILTRHGDYLHIRRSAGTEAEGAKVKISDSATGRHLFEANEPRPFDPRQEPSYKAMAAARGEMKSELVIPLVSNNEVYGAINLESNRENAFEHSAVASLMELAAVAGPPLQGLIARTEMAIRDRQIMFYAIHTMCARLGVLYNHKLQSPLHNCQTAVQLLTTEDSKLDDQQRYQLFTNLALGLTRLDHARQDLFKNFDDLVAVGPHDLAAIVREALKLFPEVNHKISFAPPPAAAPIYCAKLLREHIVNVIQNAIDSIDLRLAQRRTPPGEIEIAIFSREARDAKDLNQYLVLSIRDNGLGLDPETLANLFHAIQSTKGTCGVALTAARSFLHTIGARIDVTANEYGTENSHCEFQLTFQAYDKRIHGTNRLF